jgi:hypothetical protein
MEASSRPVAGHTSRAGMGDYEGFGMEDETVVVEARAVLAFVAE